MTKMYYCPLSVDFKYVNCKLQLLHLLNHFWNFVYPSYHLTVLQMSQLLERQVETARDKVHPRH